MKQSVLRSENTITLSLFFFFNLVHSGAQNLCLLCLTKVIVRKLLIFKLRATHFLFVFFTKLHGLPECTNSLCQQQIEQLKDQITAIENEIKEEKEKYRNVLISNLQMDVSIDELEKKTKNKRYLEFGNELSKGTIHILNSLRSLKDDDSKFLNILIRDLYKENIGVLQTTTISGRSHNNDKTPMSQSKSDLINKLFEKRLQYATEDGEVVGQRKKNLNKLIKTAIESINSAQKKQNSEKECEANKQMQP